ncbi:MAG: hypothetical protein EHM21_07900 [Chloroflexi bacterium]|nr:MAG: hypothetical protein EHM21_07900 [Chloroflexota bacterium]
MQRQTWQKISFHPDQLTNKHISHIWYFIEYTWLAERGLSRKDVYSFEYVDSSLARADYCELDLYVQMNE